MGISLLTLPFEVRSEILFFCLVSESPICIAYNKHVYLGGPLLAESNRFLAVLRTCRQLGLEGTAIFFRHNVFVYGDFVVKYDEFQPTPSEWFLEPIDARICEHQGESQTACKCSGSPDFRDTGMKAPNPSEICESPINNKFLSLIQHIVMIFRDPEGREHQLAQKYLFIEALTTYRPRLKSLFVIGSCKEARACSSHSQRPLNLNNDLPRVFGFVQSLMPSLASIRRHSPSLHVHFCAFNSQINSQISLNTTVLDENLQLRANTAMSIRAHLAAKELKMELNCSNPGVSFSLVSQKEYVTLSNDERFLLYFNAQQKFQYYDDPYFLGKAVRLIDLVRTEPWSHHDGFGLSHDPWFTVQIYSERFSQGSRSFIARLQRLLGQPPVLSWKEHESPPWGYPGDNTWFTRVPCEIFSSLWYPELQNGDLSAAEEDLSKIQDWLEMDTWELEDLAWLHKCLNQKALSNASIESGQTRMAEYFPGDQGAYFHAMST